MVKKIGRDAEWFAGRRSAELAEVVLIRNANRLRLRLRLKEKDKQTADRQKRRTTKTVRKRQI